MTNFTNVAAFRATVAVVVIFITMRVSKAFSRKKGGFPLSDESSSSSSPSAPAGSWKYDVFLSFRGEDTRKTFVDHLYSALVDRAIHTYKDDETLPRGDTISTSLLKAIQESQIAIIIFSRNYADSSWCLDELEFIMKCRDNRGQTVIPIFYDVDPSEVRKQKGEFGKAFAKQKQKNFTKTESWRKALVDASNIAGWEPKNISGGHEAKCIKDIIGTILDKLLYLTSVVDENVVGMGTRMQDLKSQLQIGSGGVRMVGIWGIGGGGKTTLASSLYFEISDKFESCCFLENIKEESNMKTLQEKILSTVLKTEMKVESVDKGKHLIKTRLGSRNVLLLLDDMDDRKQLDVLAGSHDWFGDGSRIIITTRNEQLLKTHRVDEVCRVSLLSDEEAIRLFNKRAYNKNKPIENYRMLSECVVSYAAGLPLALIVLSSFLYDKDKDEWISTLDRLKDNPEMEIVEMLKISYDGLKPLEKELFLDIACFCRGKEKVEAMVMLDACGLHPGIGVKVLIQKALITISSYDDGFGKHDVFEMHDLVQEMGHYIVKGEYPNNPEKYTRLWLKKQIDDMCSGNEKTENNITEAIISYGCPSGFCKFLSKAKKLRLLSVNNLLHKGDTEVPEYLSSKLQYLYWKRYPASPFPESFQPRKLVVLRLEYSLQDELWSGYKDLPCLKELELYAAEGLVRTPDFGGLPCLEKLRLYSCDKLEEIHPSLGNHSSLTCVEIYECEKLGKFPTIFHMGKLETLEIVNCLELREFPDIKSNMDSLVNLSLENVGIEALPSTVGKYCTKLRLLELVKCSKLKSIECNFHALKHLQKCEIRGLKSGFIYYGEPIMLPKDLFDEHIYLEELHLEHTRQPSISHLPCFLKKLTLKNCGLKDGDIPLDIGELFNLQELDISKNGFSRLNFSLSKLSQLKLLNLRECKSLIELPELPTSIAILKADNCESLEFVGDIRTNCKWLCQVSLIGVKSVIGGYILLQSMLQGHVIENGSMSLQLKGAEISKGFIPPLLVKGRRSSFGLPENWFNHFSGFLICAIVRGKHFNLGQEISMKHVIVDTTCMNSLKEEVYWEENDNDLFSDGEAALFSDGVATELFSYGETADHPEEIYETWVRYVSFDSLKHTVWWDPTSTAVEFSFNYLYDYERGTCKGFGASLVSKTTTTTTIGSSKSSDDYTYKFRIQHDSKFLLNCLFD